MGNVNEPTGYNQEEATFKAKEMEALSKLRADLDAKRKAAASASDKAAHWMCCPKCGGKMAERKLENVLVDQCTACAGMYFDAGELEMLIKHEKAGTSVLGRFFGRA